MVVQSGNDAAIALAEHVAGSEQAFAQLMNAYAAKIGMKASHFVNPHGPSAEGHMTTAHDLACSAALIRDFPEAYSYNKIMNSRSARSPSRTATCCCGAIRRWTASRPAIPQRRLYCLMASAKRGDQRLITVVMGDSSENQRAVDSQALLNWGFRFYESHKL